jgi:hypothetical protein
MTKPIKNVDRIALLEKRVDAVEKTGDFLDDRISAVDFLDDRISAVAQSAKDTATVALGVAKGAQSKADTATATATAAKAAAQRPIYAYDPYVRDPYIRDRYFTSYEHYSDRYAEQELEYRFRVRPARSSNEAVCREIDLRTRIERLESELTRVRYMTPAVKVPLTNVSSIPAWKKGEAMKAGELRTYEGRIYMRKPEVAAHTAAVPPTESFKAWRDLGPVD